MGEDAAAAASETRALRLGVDLGMTMIDTAEMYGEGRTEEFLGQALEGLRDQLYLVSKVYPHNATRAGVVQACERSLRRLRTDVLDLYLLHWPGSVPLEETVAGFEALIDAGKIRAWGVSNFDTSEMKSLEGLGCATNQILYNVTRRGPEFDLLPYLAKNGIPVMAYSPVEQGRLPSGGSLASVAARHGVSPYQVALAWVLRHPEVSAIPKASKEAHVRENHAALDIQLGPQDLEEIDAEFTPPDRKTSLEML